MSRRYVSLAAETRQLVSLARYERQLAGQGASAATAVHDALASAWESYEQIDWAKVFAADLGLEAQPGSAVNTSLDLPDEDWARLETLRAYMQAFYPGIRRVVYLPFIIRCVMRADFLARRGRLGEVMREGA